MTTQFIPVRVARVEIIATDVKLFELEAMGGDMLPPVVAGAHIDVALPDGAVRQYSLIDPASMPTVYRIAVAREADGRGGSIALHDSIVAGDLLTISEPRCHFALVEDAPHSMLFAGGIGITPIWCMAQRLQELGASFEMHVAARTRAQAALLDPILASGEQVSTYFNLEDGAVIDFTALIAGAPAGTHYYCCGPAGMLDAYRLACAGIPTQRVHFEQFSAVTPAARDGGYTIELAKSGKIVGVGPGQTILEALAGAGLRATYSCREGVCGSCETAVLAGTPDHRDAILTDQERAEGKTMMICCSGSLSERLVLDL